MQKTPGPSAQKVGFRVWGARVNAPTSSLKPPKAMNLKPKTLSPKYGTSQSPGSLHAGQEVHVTWAIVPEVWFLVGSGGMDPYSSYPESPIPLN